MTTPLTEHEALVALARAALYDDDLCAHDVLESLKAFGHASIIEEARETIDDDNFEQGVDEEEGPASEDMG